MGWLLKLGVNLAAASQQVTALGAALFTTWGALAVAGANPRTWEQLATQTWQELT